MRITLTRLLALGLLACAFMAVTPRKAEAFFWPRRVVSNYYVSPYYGTSYGTYYAPLYGGATYGTYYRTPFYGRSYSGYAVPGVTRSYYSGYNVPTIYGPGGYYQYGTSYYYPGGVWFP